MIAKIVTGKSFGGAVRYLIEKSGQARMIDNDGVELSDIRSIIAVSISSARPGRRRPRSWGIYPFRFARTTHQGLRTNL